MKIIFTAVVLFISFALSVFSQEKQQTVLEKRASEIVEIINSPKDLDKIFAPDFLAQVPPAKLTEINKSLTDNYGKALKVNKIAPRGEFAGEIEILFEKDSIAKINLQLDENAPHLIVGLLITGVEKTSATLEEIVAELKKLPGQTNFGVFRLNDKGFSPVIAHNTDKALALGSTFKLYVLAELVRSVGAGERKWSDVVALGEHSFPSGQLQNWKFGSPLTLHTLAGLMISISDNTATDQLITTLGREKIEKMLASAGNEHLSANLPLLKTIEMFKMKGAVKEKYAESYIEKDLAGKRQMLAEEIAALRNEDIDLENYPSKPAFISEIEWFASPDDLARLMNWLRLNTNKPATEKGRGIMAINPSLSEAEAKSWNYVGYKGGSENGVINLTYLLQSKKGEWFVITGGWNDEKSPVKNNEFILLMQRAVKIFRETNKL